MLSLRNLALDLELSHAYFYVVKKNQRDRFDFMFGFDDNRIKSIHMYLDYVKELRSKTEKILYRWDSNPTEFSTLLFNAGYETKINPSHIWQLYYGIEKAVHRVRIDNADWMKIDYPVIKRWEKIIEVLGE